MGPSWAAAVCLLWYSRQGLSLSWRSNRVGQLRNPVRVGQPAFPIPARQWAGPEANPWLQCVGMISDHEESEAIKFVNFVLVKASNKYPIASPNFPKRQVLADSGLIMVFNKQSPLSDSLY